MKFLFLLLISVLLCSALIKSELVDLTEKNFKDFVTSNKFCLINLCSDKISKCTKLKNNLLQVQTNIKTEMNIDLSIATVNVDSQPKIAEKFVWEGYPTIVALEDGIIEDYIGAKEVKNLMKFLRFKLTHDIEEVNSEKDILTSMKNNKIDLATVFLGDIKRSPFEIKTLSKASKIAGFKKVYILNQQNSLNKYKVDEWEVGIYKAKSEIMTILNLNDEEDLSQSRIAQILLINKSNSRGFFKPLKEIDLEYSLAKGVPTIYYLYNNKNELTPTIETDITALSKKYKNDFLFFKSSVKNSVLHKLDIGVQFNLTRDELPAMVLTAENPFNNDDVQKFIVKASDLKVELAKVLKQQNEAQNITETEVEVSIDDLITKKTVENLIESFKNGKLQQTFVTEHEDNDIKMTGENFPHVINEALEEGKEVVLLVCPKFSKKYERVKTRFFRVFSKLYDINEQKILFDEFDPFVNELSQFKYKYIPTIAYIKKNPDTFSANKWIVKTKNSKFEGKEIIKFIENNSQFKINVNNTAIPSYYDDEEIKNPLFPSLKSRLESKFLSENLVRYNIGLRRRWYSLKKHGLVLDVETSEFDNSNQFEEDYEPEEYGKYDDFVETSYEEVEAPKEVKKTEVNQEL
jgi:hypothetical protein